MKLFRRVEDLLDKERRAKRQTAQSLYAQIVQFARRPAFYRDHHVPDTLDGRFELLALHTVLVCRRLAAEGEGGAELGQFVFDTMIEDLDVNLRELGVNDPGLGKRVKEMARAFFGRRDAYAAALDGGDRAALEDAVLRNLYGTVDEPGDAVPQLSDYIEQAAAGLATLPMARLEEPRLDFPDVPEPDQT